MSLKENFVYLKVVIKKFINKIVQSHFIRVLPGNFEFVLVEKFQDLLYTDYHNGAGIVIDNYSFNNKEEIIQIIRYLTKHNKKIIIVEKIKIFNFNDIVRLSKINPKIMLDFFYIEKRFLHACNENLSCNIMTYLLIMKKINYMKKICLSKYTTDEDKFVFTIVHLSNYLRYSPVTMLKPCFENAFISRVGVCIDFALALWKVLTELDVECKLITGIANENTEHVLIDVNHAWNQVKINNIWYNVDITWYNTEHIIDYLLVSDKSFRKDGLHKVKNLNDYAICSVDFDRNILSKKIKEIEKTSNPLVDYDLGRIF